MEKKIREVSRRFSEFTVPLATVITAVDLPLGVLYGLDADGNAVLADGVKDIKAIGIVDKTSTAQFGEAFSLQQDAILKKGAWIDVLTYCIVRAEEVETGKIGDAVYLGENGLMTLTEPVTGTIQKVGTVGCPKKGLVRVEIRG